MQNNNIFLCTYKFNWQCITSHSNHSFVYSYEKSPIPLSIQETIFTLSPAQAAELYIFQ